MAHYSPERKASVLKKLLPPLNMTVTSVAAEEGISSQTLYNWRHQAKQSGLAVPDQWCDLWSRQWGVL